MADFGAPSLYGNGKGARYDLNRSGELDSDIEWKPVTGWPAKASMVEPHVEEEREEQQNLRRLMNTLRPVSMKVVARSNGADIESSVKPITANICVLADTVRVSCVNLVGVEVFGVTLEKNVSIATFESHVRLRFPGYRNMVSEGGPDVPGNALLINYAPNVCLRINDIAGAAEQYLGCWNDLTPINGVPFGFDTGDDWCVVLLALRPNSMRSIDFELIYHLQHGLPDILPVKVVEKIYLFLLPRHVVVNVAALNAQAGRVRESTGAWYYNRVQVKAGTESSAPRILSYDQNTTRSSTRSTPRLFEKACEDLVENHDLQSGLGKPTGIQLAHYIAFVVDRLVQPCNGIASHWFGSFVKYGVRGEKEDTSCIHGKCLITMADGSCKHAEDVRPGESVMTCNGRAAVVECTLQQILNGASTSACQVSPGCILTPEHPYRFMGSPEKWFIPGENAHVVPMKMSRLCNFVLEIGACAVLVGDVECITLGHELEDPAVAHPIWGGRAIRQFLQTLPGYPAIEIQGLFDEIAMQLFHHSVMSFHQEELEPELIHNVAVVA